MATGPRGSELTASITTTTVTQAVRVIMRTFDTFVDPVNYLSTQLVPSIRTEINAPSNAVLASVSLLTHTILGDGRREYRWTVTFTWTS